MKMKKTRGVTQVEDANRPRRSPRLKELQEAEDTEDDRGAAPLKPKKKQKPAATNAHRLMEEYTLETVVRWIRRAVPVVFPEGTAVLAGGREERKVTETVGRGIAADIAPSSSRFLPPPPLPTCWTECSAEPLAPLSAAPPPLPPPQSPPLPADAQPASSTRLLEESKDVRISDAVSTRSAHAALSPSHLVTPAREAKKRQTQRTCEGLCRFDVSAAALGALRDAAGAILSHAQGGTPWSSEVLDPRCRAYGFPNPAALQQLREAGVLFHMPEFGGARAAEDEAANGRASVDLSGLGLWTEPLAGAVAEVAAAVRRLVAPQYRPFVCSNRLVALQPNCHGGARHLNLHLDQPRYEGFGVVIVTVALRGDATVVLLDEGDEGDEGDAAGTEDAWSFPLCAGQGYVLSGDSRNKCLHGVLADGPDRVSMNLRFGIHAQGEGPLSFHDEVEKHWPSPKKA